MIRRSCTVDARYNRRMRTKFNRKIKYRVDIETHILSIATFVLAILFTRFRMHTYHIPFALALLLAASTERLSFPWTSAGVVLGSMIGTPSWQGMAAALLYTLIIVFVNMTVDKAGYFLKGLLFLGCYILTLPISMLYGIQEIFYGLFGVVVCASSAVCLAKGLHILKSIRTTNLLSEWDQDALLICWGFCILSCTEFQWNSVSLAIILIVLTTMILTGTRGLYGSFVASMLSATWVIYAKADARIVAIATLGAALSVPFYRQGRIWIIAAHLASALLIVAVQPEEMPFAVVWNTVAASVLFILLPRTTLRRMEELTAIDKTIAKNTRAALKRVRTRTADELTEMSALLREVSDSFSAQKAGENNTAREWAIQGAMVVCARCRLCEQCWTDADKMSNVILDLAKRVEDAKPTVPQEPIPADCPDFEEICASVLLAYQQALTRDAVFDRFGKETEFTAREFIGAGEAVDHLAEKYRKTFFDHSEKENGILKHLLFNGFEVSYIETSTLQNQTQVLLYLKNYTDSEEHCLLRVFEECFGQKFRVIRKEEKEEDVILRLEPAPKWRVSVSVSQFAAEEEENGDSFGEIRTSGGKTLFALSDGMGNGKNAQIESKSALRTLFRLFDSGMDRELVFENVNRILMHRSQNEMYATLDAVSFDLNSGTAELLKFGTPPSYLLRGTTLYTLCGEALPCGIVEEARPTVIPLEFSPNDVLFLCTDGITDALTDELESVLLCNASRKDGAEKILNAARDTGHRDDLSVMLLKVSK